MESKFIYDFRKKDTNEVFKKSMLNLHILLEDILIGFQKLVRNLYKCTKNT